MRQRETTPFGREVKNYRIKYEGAAKLTKSDVGEGGGDSYATKSRFWDVVVGYQ